MTTIHHPISSFFHHGFLVLLLIFPKLIENWLKLCDFLGIHITISYCLTISHKCLHSKYQFNRIIFYYCVMWEDWNSNINMWHKGICSKVICLWEDFVQNLSQFLLSQGQRLPLWNFIKFSKKIFRVTCASKRQFQF